MNFFEDFSELGKIINKKLNSRKRQLKYRKKNGSRNDKEYQDEYRKNHVEERRIYAIEYKKKLKKKDILIKNIMQ